MKTIRITCEALAAIERVMSLYSIDTYSRAILLMENTCEDEDE